MTDEFDDAPDPRLGADDPRARVIAPGDPTPGIPELVSEVYDQAPAPLRAKLLECLLGPVGPLALVAIGAGAFGRFLYRLTGDAVPISLEDVARISSNHVLELARYVEQCSPGALLRLGSLIGASPIGVATISGSALLLALSAFTRRTANWRE